jgi:ribosomal protein L30E
LFSRGFKSDARASSDLPEQVSTLLRRSALSYLSLAKKAGEAVAGFMKCEDLLRKGRARLVLHAVEAADDGRRKLAQAATGDVAVLDLFRGEELDLALGRSHVVHAAVARGGLAEKLLAAARRIEAYEAGWRAGIEERA